ncbi:MAG: DNA adenine methylase, partial [Bacillota bacterium]
LHANPIGGKSQSSAYPIGCRFNKATVIGHIKRIALFRDRLTVRWGDAISYLTDNLRQLSESRCFVYVDPPYYKQGKELYRYHYTDQQHEELASLLRRACFPWLLSYDDHPFIRNLYTSQAKDLTSRHLYLDYTAQKRKRGRELLISNLELPPIVREMPRVVRADA